MNAQDTAFEELVGEVRALFFTLRGVSEELLAGFDCTAVERGVLMDLEKLGPQTVPAMAEARSVSRQAMQKTVDKLVDRRWLALAPNPRHLKSPLVEPTPLGRKTFGEMRAREAAALAAAPLPLSVAEMRRTASTLEKLRQFLTERDWSAARARHPGGRT